MTVVVVEEVLQQQFQQGQGPAAAVAVLQYQQFEQGHGPAAAVAVEHL